MLCRKWTTLNLTTLLLVCSIYSSYVMGNHSKSTLPSTLFFKRTRKSSAFARKDPSLASSGSMACWKIHGLIPAPWRDLISISMKDKSLPPSPLPTLRTQKGNFSAVWTLRRSLKRGTTCPSRHLRVRFPFFESSEAIKLLRDFA